MFFYCWPAVEQMFFYCWPTIDQMFYIVGPPSTKCFILLAIHRQMFYIVGPPSLTVAQQYKTFGRRWANNIKHSVDVSCRGHWQWRTGMVDGVAWLAAVSLTGCVRRSAWQTGRRSSRQDEIFSLDIPASLTPPVHSSIFSPVRYPDLSPLVRERQTILQVMLLPAAACCKRCYFHGFFCRNYGSKLNSIFLHKIHVNIMVSANTDEAPVVPNLCFITPWYICIHFLTKLC